MGFIFEWDENKAKKNLHKLSFHEARTVFTDTLMMTFPDEDHSEEEYRQLSIGVSSNGRVLVVVHTERGERIRIISSRKATKSERSDYEKGNFQKG